MTEEEIDARLDTTAKEQSRWIHWSARLANHADIAESRFLALLRYSALTVAAIVLLAAVLLLILGAVRQLGKTHVAPENVAISSDDVIPPKTEPAKLQPAPEPKQLGINQEIRSRTLSVYRVRFKGFQRPDTKITDQQIVDFVWSEDRIAKFDKLARAGIQDKDGKRITTRSAMMLEALGIVDTAAQSSAFRQQLAAYRDAKKVNICSDEVQSRRRTVESWDPYSTSCSGWYVSPVGCASTRVIDEPVIVKTCAMKFPEHLEDPAQQLASAVQRYAEMAEAKLEQERSKAEAQTARNYARKLEGQENISSSGKLFLGFLALMFLYLFVAVERHHRSLRALIDRGGRD